MGRRAAGVTCVADTTGRIFLMRRSPLVTDPGWWSCPAGRLERREEALQGAVRELGEESGYWGPLAVFEGLRIRQGSKTFYHFIAVVPSQFTPVLNWENDAAAWCDLCDLPSPVHPGMKHVLRRL